ncbi:MAG: DUF3748 domain-containing protein [Opitutus sp.]
MNALSFGGLSGLLVASLAPISVYAATRMEKQLTFAPKHHDLDNNDNFSPDDRWLVFDTRDEQTAISGNAVIGRVFLESGKEAELYREPHARPWGPGVGAASVNPRDGSVVFIRGLPSATQQRPYGMWRRGGACLPAKEPGDLVQLDARDVIAPFTPGALRGGTHRHEWSADGQWIGFTYNDALLAEIEERTGERVNLRTVGVATRIGGPVSVPSGRENQNGELFSAVVVRVVPNPRPGSDEISKAFEDAWVGTNGYRKPDGAWQKRARAFLGTVRTADGREVTEVFVVDIPDKINVASAGEPLEGTPTTMPGPPRGCIQRRLTYTEERQFPGVALEPRHWVRSSPDGAQIVFLAKDDSGVVQGWFVNSANGVVVQVTHHARSVQSCVRWSSDGSQLLYVGEGSLMICDARTGTEAFGKARALTGPSATPPENPVWSHDGRVIAFNRRVEGWKQIFTVGTD